MTVIKARFCGDAVAGPIKNPAHWPGFSQSVCRSDVDIFDEVPRGHARCGKSIELGKRVPEAMRVLVNAEHGNFEFRISDCGLKVGGTETKNKSFFVCCRGTCRKASGANYEL